MKRDRFYYKWNPTGSRDIYNLSFGGKNLNYRENYYGNDDYKVNKGVNSHRSNFDNFQYSGSFDCNSRSHPSHYDRYSDNRGDMNGNYFNNLDNNNLMKKVNHHPNGNDSHAFNNTKFRNRSLDVNNLKYNSSNKSAYMDSSKYTKIAINDSKIPKKIPSHDSLVNVHKKPKFDQESFLINKSAPDSQHTRTDYTSECHMDTPFSHRPSLLTGLRKDHSTGEDGGSLAHTTIPGGTTNDKPSDSIKEVKPDSTMDLKSGPATDVKSEEVRTSTLPPRKKKIPILFDPTDFHEQLCRRHYNTKSNNWKVLPIMEMNKIGRRKLSTSLVNDDYSVDKPSSIKGSELGSKPVTKTSKVGSSMGELASVEVMASESSREHLRRKVTLSRVNFRQLQGDRRIRKSRIFGDEHYGPAKGTRNVRIQTKRVAMKHPEQKPVKRERVTHIALDDTMTKFSPERVKKFRAVRGRSLQTKTKHTAVKEKSFEQIEVPLKRGRKRSIPNESVVSVKGEQEATNDLDALGIKGEDTFVGVLPTPIIKDVLSLDNEPSPTATTTVPPTPTTITDTSPLTQDTLTQAKRPRGRPPKPKRPTVPENEVMNEPEVEIKAEGPVVIKEEEVITAVCVPPTEVAHTNNTKKVGRKTRRKSVKTPADDLKLLDGGNIFDGADDLYSNTGEDKSEEYKPGVKEKKSKRTKIKVKRERKVKNKRDQVVLHKKFTRQAESSYEADLRLAIEMSMKEMAKTDEVTPSTVEPEGDDKKKRRRKKKETAMTPQTTDTPSILTGPNTHEYVRLKMSAVEEYLELSERLYCGKPICTELSSNLNPNDKIISQENGIYLQDCSSLEENFRVSFDILKSEHRQPQVIDLWGPKEIVLFELGIFKYGKEFHEIQRDIPSKSVKEIVDMYYLWKKTNRYRLWKSNRCY